MIGSRDFRIEGRHHLEDALTDAHHYFREVAVFAIPTGLFAVVSLGSECIADAQTVDLRGLVRVALIEAKMSFPELEEFTDFIATSRPLPKLVTGGWNYDALWEMFCSRENEGSIQTEELRDGGPLAAYSSDAAKVWEWLEARFAPRNINASTSPILDLGLDSIDWLELVMALEHSLNLSMENGIDELPFVLGDFVARFRTKRDLDCSIRLPSFATLPDTLNDERWLQRKGWATKISARFLLSINRLLFQTLFRLSVSGLDGIPQSGAFVLVVNHVSDLDVLAVPAALPLQRALQLHFGGFRGRLFQSRAMRWLSKVGQVFPLSDRSPRQSLGQALAVLRDGGILNWFPEMWRSPNGKLQPFHKGIGVLLQETGATAVPVFISGTHELMPRWRKFPKFGPVSVKFGAPVSASNLEQRGAGASPYERITSALHDLISALSQEVRDAQGLRQDAQSRKAFDR